MTYKLICCCMFYGMICREAAHFDLGKAVTEVPHNHPQRLENLGSGVLILFNAWRETPGKHNTQVA